MGEATIEIKSRANGNLYWILKAPNGQVMVRSYCDYASIAAVYNAIARVKKWMGNEGTKVIECID